MTNRAGMMKKFKESKGFSLVEILVSMAIVGMVMAGVYVTYASQQRSYVIQEQVAAMQQNLRAGLNLMEREIRMAGYDPKGSAGAGIVTMGANSIRITMDITDDTGTSPSGDGDTQDSNEDITYSLYTSNGIKKLGRKSPSTGTNQPVAENIDALDFVYLDGNRNPIDPLTGDPADVRSIEITIVARTGRPNRGYTDTQSYFNQRDPTHPQNPIFIANDNYRRKVLSVEVKCRNLGLI